MQYPELDGFNSTDEQAKGLAIATALGNQQRANDKLPTLTDGEYLIVRVQALLNGYAAMHVTAMQETWIVEAFRLANEAEKAATASALKIDLTVPIPDVIEKPIDEEAVSGLGAATP